MQINEVKFDTSTLWPVLQSAWSEGETAARTPTVVALIDDDQIFRQELGLNLVDENFWVVEFGDGQRALEYFGSGRRCDVILMDWKMPSPSGTEMLHRFGEMGLRVPVIVLTAYCDEKTEEDALDRGAIDVLHKSRSPSILAKRLRIIAKRTKPSYCRDVPSNILSSGALTLNVKMHRAFWKGERVPLTVTEFRIVCLLASREGEDIAYREIYDVVHGKEFKAGDGANGFHANVRSLIRHVRRKFRSLDGNFAAIENYPGFGYRWRGAESRSGQTAPGDAAEPSTAIDDSVASLSTTD